MKTNEPANNAARAENQPQTKPDFEKVSQFKYIVKSTLGVLAAFFCGVCLAYLSAVFVLPLIVLVLFGMIWMTSSTDWVGLDSPITFLILGLASSLFFFSGMVIGRFLLRAIPPRLSGKRRKGVLGCIAVLTVSSVVSVFWHTFVGMDATPSISGVAETLPLPAMSQNFNSSTAFRTLQVESLVFWWLGFAVPLALRHWSPRRFLNQPFVLFLRRFSGFPDRTVQHVVLKCAPPGKPVAFLTPTGSRVGDWDPFRVGFSGIKLRRPIRSMPIILRSTNEDWKPAATELIDRAELIVLDVSEGSGAIQFEIDVIDAAARWQDVVVLVQEGKAETSETEQIARFTNKGATAITYKKSWSKAIIRLLFGAFVTYLVIVPLLYLLPMLGNTVTGFNTFSLVTDSGEPVTLSIPLNLFLSEWYRLVAFAFYWYVYIIFFVRPALSKSAVTALSMRLKAKRG
jgi:hypothetical protein